MNNQVHQVMNDHVRTLAPHLGHVHGAGQEVGGHVADQHWPLGVRGEVELHAVHRLVAAVVQVGGA